MKLTHPLRRALLLALLTVLGISAALFAACSEEVIPLTFTSTPTRTPRHTPTLTPSPTSTPAPTPTPAWPVTVFVPSGLPVPVAAALNATLTDNSDLFELISSPDEAQIQVTFGLSTTLKPGPIPGGTPLAEWTYAIVVPFPTLTDEVSWTQVISHWIGIPAGPFAEQPLLMTADAATTLSAVMGDPAPGVVEIVPAEEILQRAWDTRSTWAVVAFDQLEPRWKVLHVNGASPLDK